VETGKNSPCPTGRIMGLGRRIDKAVDTAIASRPDKDRGPRGTSCHSGKVLAKVSSGSRGHVEKAARLLKEGSRMACRM
jgi:hypothetical protein